MGALRRLFPALAVLAVLLLGGCASLYDTEYAVRELYQAPVVQAPPEDAGENAPAYNSIADFDGLRQAVMQLVADHVESAQLQFSGYEGSISEDLSAVCWDVKSSTALGAFAVDHISYDLSRIVSYYQAEVRVTYKRSAAQAAALERARTGAELTDRLGMALRSGETYLVLETADAAATADTIRAKAAELCFDDPMACPVVPELEVGLFPETGTSRIAEIRLDYGMDASALDQRRRETERALDELVGDLLPTPEPTPGPTAEPVPEKPTPEPDPLEEGMAPEITAAPESETESLGDAQAQAALLRTLCRRLMDRCRADEDAGSTVWDALVGGAADSQGMALALKAGCQALGLECLVVTGRLDDEPHFWDMTALAGTSYHVDVSRAADNGDPAVFLAGDARLWGAYWWDTSDYPACPWDLGGPGDQEPSPEPTAYPRPMFL